MSAVLPDLTPFFARYEELVAQADALFAKVLSDYSKEVICKQGCSSCCHALFDLSLVEALYLNKKFLETITDGKKHFAIHSKADAIDRQTVKLKRSYYREMRDGKESNDILTQVAHESVRCPLLDETESCILYAYRPITCRIYGVPAAIGGKAHTCGKTGFVQGTPYPTVHLDKIQFRLAEISKDLAESIGTSYLSLHTMYVPVSSALLTTYDASYLGIGGIPKED